MSAHNAEEVQQPAQPDSGEVRDYLRAECNHFVNGRCDTRGCMAKLPNGALEIPVRFVGCGNYRAVQELSRLQSALAAAQERHAEGLAAWKANNAHHAQVIDRMRAKLLHMAGECAECGGSGEVMTKSGVIENEPCPDCKDIREAAGA